MSANKSKWRLVILTEDPAYEDLAKGFRRNLPQCVQRQVDVAEPPKGGRTVLYEVAKKLAETADEKRIILVLTDFDSKVEGSNEDEDNASIDERVREFDAIREADKLKQTFVLGPLQEAENLVTELAVKLPAKGRQDVTQDTSEIRCGLLFGSDDLRCDESLWQCRQLRHYYNMMQLDELCVLLKAKLLADCRGTPAS